MGDSVLIDTLAGMVGGVASVLVGQPLDTVKVKMQLFPNMYKGMISCMRKTVAQQRFVGLYAGTVPALISNCADNAVLFGTYGQCQKLVASLAGSSSKELNWAQNAAAGTCSSVFTSMALCPTELVKIRMQGYDYTLDGSNEPKHLSVGKMVKDIWNKGGFRGMYRGLWATMVREGLGSTAFFGTYELARELLTPPGQNKDELNATGTMVSGALSGVAMWLVSYPMDVIKSRVQMSEKGINGGYRSVWSEIASFRALYSGLGPTLTKSVPVCGVLLFTVELSKKFLYNLLPSSSDANPSNKPTAAFSTSGSPIASGPPTPDSPPPATTPPAVPPVRTETTADDQFFSFCDFISGWVAGVVSTCVGHPMDTVKVVQQVNNSSVREAFGNISKENRFTGYFRGMMFPLLLAGLLNSVFFGVYANTMRLIQSYRSSSSKDPSEDGDVRYCCDSENLRDSWHLDLFVSGCVGGFFYSLINIPTEVVKTMLQASSASESKIVENAAGKIEPSKINSPIKLIANIYKTHGIRSLYRGGTLLMIRDVPSMGLYVITYEHLYCYLRTLESPKHENKSVSAHVPIIAGGVAGVLSCIFFLPVDVIKSKVIAESFAESFADLQHRSTWDYVKTMYRDGGASRFFRGFWLISIRAFPVNGLTFLVYELVLKSCAADGTDGTAIVSLLSPRVPR